MVSPEQVPEPPIKIEPMFPLDANRAEALLEVRNPQIKEIEHQIIEHDVLILAAEARSGSTSLLRYMAENKGYRTISSLAINDTWSVSDIASSAEERDLPYQLFRRLDPHDSKQKVVLLHEAGQLTKLKPDEQAAFWKTVEALCSNDIKVVLATHEHVREKVAKTMESHSNAENLDHFMTELESCNQGDIENIFDVLVGKEPRLQGLLEYKNKMLELAHSPQHLLIMASEYLKGESWEHIQEPDMSKPYIAAAVNDGVRTTGGEPLWKLIQKVGNSGLPTTELAAEEKILMEKLRKFHFLEEKSDGTIQVRGKWLLRANKPNG